MAQVDEWLSYNSFLNSADTLKSYKKCECSDLFFEDWDFNFGILSALVSWVDAAP